MDRNGWDHRLGDLAEVAVVGEVDDLPKLADLPEESEHRCRSDMVEGFHDVVGNEGHRRTKSGELLVTGQSKRQV